MVNFSKMYLEAREIAYRTIGHGAISDSVIILGSPRSGTTWLAQIVATLSGYKHLDKPLRLAPALVRKLNLKERNYVGPTDERPNYTVT